MSDQFSRNRLMFGDEGVQALQRAHVAVFGLGGVGGYAAESLVRSGIGAIDLIDCDTVDITNVNRQIIATHRTLGMKKTDAAEQRLLDINPACRITKHDCFFLPETAHLFSFAQYDYIIDAVDTISAKIELIVRAQEARTPLISAMGAGNKMDPTALRVDDIYNTSVCRLARVMRKELRKRGIAHQKVVYSIEETLTPATPTQPGGSPADQEASSERCADSTDTDAQDAVPCTPHPKRATPGSNAFVPSAMGLVLGAEVARDLMHLSR